MATERALNKDHWKGMFSQIIHLQNPRRPNEGICGIIVSENVYHHVLRDMDHIQNRMWTGDVVCEHCKLHPDWPLYYLGNL